MKQEGDDATSVPVDEVGWSTRVRNCFEHHDVKTLGDIMALGEWAMMRWENFGKVSAKEVRATLLRHGLRLPRSPPVDRPLGVTTMRARIAARLARLEWSGAEFANWRPEAQAPLLAKADAILDELREPTEAMEVAALDLGPDRAGVTYWRRMIDKAKEER